LINGGVELLEGSEKSRMDVNAKAINQERVRNIMRRTHSGKVEVYRFKEFEFDGFCTFAQ
jgi:hypothetical protein